MLHERQGSVGCVLDSAGDSGMPKVQAVGEDKAVRLPGRRPSRLLAG